MDREGDDAVVRVPWAQATETVAALLRQQGAPDPVALEVARHLVEADASGHASHGVARLPQYETDLAAGRLVASAVPEVLSRTGASSVMDAHRGFGHYSTMAACDATADAARTHGIGVVAIRHSGHVGRLGRYCESLAGRGLVSIVTVGMAGEGVGAMVIPGTSRRFLGANPWAFGVPAATPLIVDISSAMVAEGKILVAHAAGASLPEGLVVNRTGSPTTSPADYLAGGGLLPLGGLLAGHKGFGLALAAALVSSLGTIGDDDLSLAGAGVADSSDPRGRTAGVLVLAMDPAAFGDAERYSAMASETLWAAHRQGDGVVLPGEPEAASRAGAERDGVPFARETWEAVRALAERHGLATP